MIVQHNMTALNANRQLGITNTNLSKSTEKLSSGYRVNRAADDAAGLSISEKMRGQIRGLNQASTNAQDGTSLIQTAEGALSEMHSVLQRMRELTVQASNDTYVTADRAAIALEVRALTSEIDRISSQTEFNTMKLLSGGFTGKVLQVGANNGQLITFSISAMSSAALSVGDTKVAAIISKTATGAGITSVISIVNTALTKYLFRDLLLVLSRTDWSIQFLMQIIHLRICSLQRAASVILIWQKRWYLTQRAPSFSRQVSLCWLRQIRLHRVCCHFFSSYYWLDYQNDMGSAMWQALYF